MNVKSCKICKRLYNYIGGLPLCQVCKEEAESRFSIVKEYIYDHPGASIQEVSETCDVKVEQIRHWLREERIELSKDSAIFLNCKACGKPINCGNYCGECKNNLHNGLKSAIHGNQNNNSNENAINKRILSDKDKMRYLNN